MWTRLNPLPPEIDGGLESFTSFLTRLAASHVVRTRSLIKFLEIEFSRDLKAKHYWNTDVGSLNGLGPRARSYVEVLEKATGNRDLSPLTAIAFHNIISPSAHDLVSKIRRICPYCIGEDITQGRPAYDRKAWAFKLIVCCIKHKCLLIDHCYQCKSRLDYFAGYPSISRCKICASPLYRHPSRSVSTDDFYRSNFFQSQIIEFTLENRIARPSAVADYIQALISNGISMKEIADHSGLNARSIGEWRTLLTKPQLGSLITLAASMGVTITDLVFDPFNAASSSSFQLDIVNALNLSSRGRQRYSRLDKRKAEQLIENCENDLESFVSQQHLALTLGVKTTTLQHHFGDRLKDLSVRAKKRSAEARRTKKDHLVEEGRKILVECLAEYGLLSRAAFIPQLVERTGCTQTRAKNAYSPAVRALESG